LKNAVETCGRRFGRTRRLDMNESVAPKGPAFQHGKSGTRLTGRKFERIQSPSISNRKLGY
jgi:hypothetical protein